jgi:hypothetical protein
LSGILKEGDRLLPRMDQGLPRPRLDESNPKGFKDVKRAGAVDPA